MSSPTDDRSAEDSPPTGNRYDQMFGDYSDNDEKLSVKESGDESDVGSRKHRRSINGDADVEEDGEGQEEEKLDELDEELFGDEEEVDGSKPQVFDDDELASEREEREDTPEEPVLKRQADISLGRYTLLDPGTTGDLYLMKIPQYLPLIPELFDVDTFTVPKSTPTQPSPYTLATTAIRFRQHLTDPSKYQSNSRIIRWSDGTLSLQIGSSPELYDLPSKPLAPPPKSTDYDPTQDSHTYLVTPHEGANMLRFIAHATQSLSVMAAGEDVSDEAMARLHEQLAAAVQAKGGMRVKNMEIQNMEDPEKLKREAEKAEKERMRAQKRQEAQRRKHDTLPERGGLSGSRGSAGTAGSRLTAADLEERRRERRGGRSSPSGRRGATREDDYDRGDGFLADEDQEDDFIVDDEDGDEEMDQDNEDDEEETERRQRAKLKKAKEKAAVAGSPKKASSKPKKIEVDEEEEEEEAEFTEESEDERREKRKKGSPGRDGKGEAGNEDEDKEEEEVRAGGGGRKRRRFVVDDDEEE
ncbi:hypothetical protein L211DRAFT_868148 [Terfezia boudieri ATCC MYA-4762]|uniref:Leo1-domain-containing protein n=1 Tax=Terfezia boudieri ATCC MYA-4762 TaxID=1051890 RepID=A0A3N4LR43_9PEZI|nr:hypothetical protein L211DRAFT_868148 [Terfezia boudieri ATCC MYA-4762]